MKFSFAAKTIAVSALCMLTLPAFSHISLETKTAMSGSTYKAVFQVGHGCEGAATTGVSVQIPAGFQGAKPYPKAGWRLTTQSAKLAQAYANHGKPVTEDVSVVSWTAASKEAALPDAYFDEFTLRGTLPEAGGPMWFKVLQTCENGQSDWSEIPATGASPKGLKFPAVLLQVTGPETAAAAASAPAHAAGAHQH